MRSRLRVLLISSNADDLLFLDKVVTDIPGKRFWSHWVQFETVHALSWPEALEVLPLDPLFHSSVGCEDEGNQQLDAIILNLPEEPTSDLLSLQQHLQAFLHLPVVLMARPSQHEVAVHLVREGVQDFLFKHEINSATLARMLENAIARHRLLEGERASRATDSLTGLLNRESFLRMAVRELALAAEIDCEVLIAVVEPQGIATFGAQWMDLALVQAAEHLHTAAGPAALLGRLSELRLGMVKCIRESQEIDATGNLIAALGEHRIAAGVLIAAANECGDLEELLASAALDLAPRIPARKAVAARG